MNESSGTPGRGNETEGVGSDGQVSGYGSALLRVLGVRIVPVVDLGPDGHYLPSLRVLLIDADLDEDQRNEVNDRVLGLEELWASVETT